MNKLLAHRKNAFTLVELLIVMTIIGILSVILFRTFWTISSLAFRIEQQKNVSQEIVILTQILQNYSDRNVIDYQKYFDLKSSHSSSLNDNIVADSVVEGNGLVENKWIVDILYLSGQDGQISLFTSGTCIDPADQFISSWTDQECALYVQKSWMNIQITNPKKIYLSKMFFKIIPFASQEQYLTGSWLCAEDKLMYCLNTPGFWIVAQGYNPRYSISSWWNKVQIPIQQFFNLK